MKLLNRVNERLALSAKPMTPVEIDEHEDAGKIWATIAVCRSEANEAVAVAFEMGSSTRDKEQY